MLFQNVMKRATQKQADVTTLHLQKALKIVLTTLVEAFVLN